MRLVRTGPPSWGVPPYPLRNRSREEGGELDTIFRRRADLRRRILTWRTFRRSIRGGGVLLDSPTRHTISRILWLPPPMGGCPRKMLIPGRGGNCGSVRKPTTDTKGPRTYNSGNMSSTGCGLSWKLTWRMRGRISDDLSTRSANSQSSSRWLLRIALASR